METAKRLERLDWRADTEQFVGQAAGVELLHGSRMDGEGSAQVGFVIAPFQQRHLDSGTGEIARKQKPGRAGADHQNVRDWCPVFTRRTTRQLIPYVPVCDYRPSVKVPLGEAANREPRPDTRFDDRGSAIRKPGGSAAR